MHVQKDNYPLGFRDDIISFNGWSPYGRRSISNVVLVSGKTDLANEWQTVNDGVMGGIPRVRSRPLQRKRLNFSVGFLWKIMAALLPFAQNRKKTKLQKREIPLCFEPEEMAANTA